MRTEYSTRAREQITTILRKERRYLSAAEIHSLLKKSRAQVSLSTVYRTLDLLATKGEASSRVDARGEATFVVCAPTHHHHAICRSCGKVEELACEALERIAGELRSHHGFELDDHAMEFFGRCAACRV
ncbi:MAG TPA: transcriptional repressor [Candidatus Baltobacteraceae bacterium]|nr:transcriptional repressor [Candidatus Baltobacteraceae bacterium]